MLKKILLSFLLLSGLVSLFFSAWLSWLSDSLVSDAKGIAEDKLNNQFSSVSYPGLFPAPIKQLLSQGAGNPNMDNDLALKLLEVYLQGNPLDANAWLIGSQFYQRAENIERASVYLDVAHQLSETNTPVLMKVFNRYLELNLINKAMPVAHDISVAKPSEFRRLFFLMGRLSNDYARVASNVIPQLDSTIERRKVKSLDGGVFYDWALSDAIKAKNKNLANEVWDIIPSDKKLNSELGIKYLNFLAGYQELELVKSAWNDVVGKPMQLGQILNQGGDEISPCWYFNKRDEFEVSSDLDDRNSTVIKLEFLGEANMHFNHVSCLVFVQPGSQYELVARFKGDKISTLSGPYLDIYFPGVRSGPQRTEDMVGSWDWTNVGLLFNVPENVYVAKIRIRRNKTKLLDSKISGTVWYDSMRLSRKKNALENPSNSLLK